VLTFALLTSALLPLLLLRPVLLVVARAEALRALLLPLCLVLLPLQLSQQLQLQPAAPLLLPLPAEQPGRQKAHHLHCGAVCGWRLLLLVTPLLHPLLLLLRQRPCLR
jgi:hypothetical protein